jgi:hypothetical protein
MFDRARKAISLLRHEGTAQISARLGDRQRLVQARCHGPFYGRELIADLPGT